ncbi:hypothetical protein [Streptomyces halobius]|uniref:Uncharacterized protein n=1 Tax=Streptomyces halobius TaxID=2879846 RepID=A0ABY4M6V4_9ACTN|nr:hypothetical protein [Streptomyces halobius]UQA93450.1 hypothetical protein K9S39_17760 [Streptomyces halobius]
MTIRPSDVGRVLKWGGLAGVAVSLLLRYVEPAPRWDVLACMGVGLLGLLVSWVSARRERAADQDVSEVAEGATPSSPTGFRLHADWRPDRTQRQQFGALLLLLSVAFLLFGSASHVTPQLADARDGSASIDQVKVTKVLSHSSRPIRGGGMSHTSKLSVTVDSGDGDGSAGKGASLQGMIMTSSSVGYGERLWALHVPGENDRGVQLAESRDELEALRDGGIRPSGALLGISAAAAAGGLALLLRRRLKRFDDSGPAVAEALRTGNAQALAVTSAGTAPEGRRSLGVGLRHMAEDGERQLFVSRFVDVEHLADALCGRTAWLYWERAGDRDAPLGRPGRRGELLPAVLVIGSGAGARYVRGWMPRKPEWPVAQGRRLGPVSPDTCPEVRRLGAGTLRPPRPRVGAVMWLGLAALAAVAAAAFPIGGGGQALTQVVIVVTVLCTIVGMRKTEAKWRPSARRQERRDAAGNG